jgi:DNA-directed RNA polymerase specialized sigma24 family protein
MGAGVDDAEASFDDWVRPHVTAMRRLAAVLSSADDCDDIVQEALERAWHRRADFDAARGVPRQRQAVRLFYYAALTVAEIATITRISEGTVKSTLYDARRRLAELLEDTDVATR